MEKKVKEKKNRKSEKNVKVKKNRKKWIFLLTKWTNRKSKKKI